MKALQGIRITSLLMAIVMLATLFVPAVSAKADISENKESAAAVDISKEISVSEEDLKKALENVNVLKETDNEKIVSFKKDDGSTGYVVSWVDKKNPDKKYFAFVDQDELVDSKLVSAEKLSDSTAVAATISMTKTSFWHGSYIEKYGTSISGGIHIQFSKTDASYLMNNGTRAVAALAILLTPYIGVAASFMSLIIATILDTVYFIEQNSNGSIDLWITYKSIAKLAIMKSASIKIGKHSYPVARL
ncbi:hypothetical protein [Methanomethylovorans sp.]|uniref:hypothetical protein n=1 Tax=Methanomethylovorans sp. TaxID=2758717 RepID=UPI00351C9856